MKRAKGSSKQMVFGLTFLCFSLVFSTTMIVPAITQASEPVGQSAIMCPVPKEVNVDVGTSALLMLHWQNDLVMPEGKLSKEWWKRIQENQVIEHAKTALNAAREAGMYVVFVNLGYQAGYPEAPPRKYLKGYIAQIVDGNMLAQGTWGTTNVDQLKPLNNEPKVWNWTASGFEANNLDRILRNRGIKSLFLSGIATNYVVETTMRAGRDIGYQNFVLMDCCDAANQNLHCWPLANTISHMAVVTDSTRFIEALKKSK